MELRTIQPNVEVDPKNITLEEFYGLCIRHDWTYAMSDDHRAWTAGTKAQNLLHQIILHHPEWVLYYNAISRWGWEGGEKPTLESLKKALDNDLKG